MDTRPTISSLVLPLKGRKKGKKNIVIRIEIEKEKKFEEIFGKNKTETCFVIDNRSSHAEIGIKDGPEKKWFIPLMAISPLRVLKRSI